MEQKLQRLRITEDKRVFLDDFEFRNVRGFELKEYAGESAEFVLKMNVSLNEVGFESGQ